MDRAAARQLAARLGERLPGAAAVHLNEHAGLDRGWGVQVQNAAGETRSIIGSDASGYTLTDAPGGWRSFDLIVEEVNGPRAEEVLADQPALVDRMTEVASLLRRAADELCVVRDELMLRASR